MPIRSPSAAPPSPGTSAASAIAIRPAARPNWREPVERARRRGRPCSRAARSRRSARRPATGTGDGSKRSMRFTGEALRRSPARNAGRPMPIAEITPSPVTQTSPPLVHVRRSSAGRVGAQGLGEVAHGRERPAGDRAREQRGRRTARSRGTAAGSRARSRSASGRPRSSRSSRSRPCPASRRPRGGNGVAGSAGSCQVRLRHATGMPRPSHGTMTRRATKSHTSDPSASRRTTRERA